MESSSASTNQEEPLDLSLGNSNGELTEEQQQIIQFVETCGMVLQQNLFTWLLQSVADTVTVASAIPTQFLPEGSPEKENNCDVGKRGSADENDSTPSPTQTRRRTSAGKPDRRMVGRMCTRRVEANARERNRVQQLSKMFDQLRLCLPIGEDIKISKLATLKVASAYIGFLGSLLETDSGEEDESRTKLQAELESAKTLRK